ncbi:SHOCT domain-containing protein [Fictibacillus sp. NPDC058756]|uniref:SHOCT domain-containing protein n=1 Tax=Fictibacillus sp. NPDC058756 TaxID=3346625 RepID=UPI0036B074A7
MGCVLVGFALFLLIFIFSISPLLGIIVLGAIIGVSYYFKNKEEDRKATESIEKSQKIYEATRSLNDFKVTQRFTSYDSEMTLLLDEDSKKLCLIYTSNQSKEIYNYSDILSSEILEDGVTVINTSRSSQIGGALIGGVLAGGVGAIIGGLSAQKTSTNKVNKVDLKIIVNNTKSPYKLINILTTNDIDINGNPSPIERDSQKYKDAMNNANHWHNLISVLIKQADLEDNKATKSNQTSGSLADEIKKLSDLHKAGILTEEEFNNQKLKLLS